MRVIVAVLGLIFLSIPLIAQEKLNSDCPMISVTGPSGLVSPGQLAMFSAQIDNKANNFTLEYEWSTSVGKIVTGQGTSRIEVVMPAHSLTVTLEVKGLPSNCPNIASESMSWDPTPIPIKLDEFIGSLTKVRTERFIEAFNKAKDDSYAQVYILISGARRNPKSSIRKKRQVLMKHITVTCRYDTQRVTFVDVDNKQDDRVTIWLVPAGANPPTP